MTDILEFRINRMSEEDYKRERERIRSTYGDSGIEAAAKRDQALAALMHRSGWTQEQLAQEEGLSRPRVTQRLTFGRFLDFVTSGNNSQNLPKNLTERRFRGYWEQTEKDLDERFRFREVGRLIKDELTAIKDRGEPLTKPIIEGFADGEWHAIATIARNLEVEPIRVENVIGRMRSSNKQPNPEFRKTGAARQVRMFRPEKMISSHELATKLWPIIKSLVQEGNKHMATMSPDAVARNARQLQQLLDEWTK